VAQDKDSEPGNETSSSINEWNIWTSWGAVSFSGRTVLRGVMQQPA
jgi:hypothetical protein